MNSVTDLLSYSGLVGDVNDTRLKCAVVEDLRRSGPRTLLMLVKATQQPKLSCLRIWRTNPGVRECYDIHYERIRLICPRLSRR